MGLFQLNKIADYSAVAVGTVLGTPGALLEDLVFFHLARASLASFGLNRIGWGEQESFTEVAQGQPIVYGDTAASIYHNRAGWTTPHKLPSHGAFTLAAVIESTKSGSVGRGLFSTPTTAPAAGGMLFEEWRATNNRHLRFQMAYSDGVGGGFTAVADDAFDASGDFQPDPGTPVLYLARHDPATRTISVIAPHAAGVLSVTAPGSNVFNVPADALRLAAGQSSMSSVSGTAKDNYLFAMWERAVPDAEIIDSFYPAIKSYLEDRGVDIA